MYCIPQEVRDVLYPGTATTPSAGAADLDPDYVMAFIAEAENEVNARLAVRYSVPFVDGAVPSIISTITRDLAAFYCDASNRGQLPYSGQYDPILMRRDNARDLLEKLVSGKSDLGTPPPADGSDSHAGDAGRAGAVINPLRPSFTPFDAGGDSLQMGGVAWEYDRWGPYGRYGSWW